MFEDYTLEMLCIVYIKSVSVLVLIVLSFFFFLFFFLFYWFQVAVTLSTLSFYCRRPTILAIMDFLNDINSPKNTDDTLSDVSSTYAAPYSEQKEIVNDGLPYVSMEEPLESLLGKGKSRVVFYLLLNMARAEIFLMKENDSKLATLAQDNFLTDIKVCMHLFIWVLI